MAPESAKGRPQLRKTTIGYSKKKLRKVFTGSSHLDGSARKSKQVYKKTQATHFSNILLYL